MSTSTATAPSKNEAAALNDVQIEKGEGGLVTLKIEIAPDSVKQARQDAIRNYARRMKIPGFRPGHAPANIVRRNVGDEAIAREVGDSLIEASYQKAVEDNDFKPMVQAQVADMEFDAFDDAKPMRFNASFVTRPEIELGEISGLEAKKPKIEVVESDIDAGLDRLREDNATLRNVEGRGAKEGDVLTASLQVYTDGVAKGEEPATLRAFVLGQSGFQPSIDEHLIGIELDQERRFDVTYPSDFNDAELAGQVAEFAVTATAIKERVLPELDEAFATRVGAENLEAMRERMRSFVEQTRERDVLNYMTEQVTAKAVEQAQLEVPTELVKRRVHERIHNIEHELEQQKKTIDDHLKEISKSREELEADLTTEIGDALRRELVLDEIAQRNELKVSEEEFEQYYMQMAQMMGQPVETLIERLDAGAIHASLLRRKASDWLRENATVVETDEPLPHEENAV